jgi:hypothetical protein
MAHSAWKAGPLKTVFALLLLFGPALFLILISTRGCEHKFKVLDDYGPIASYQLTTVDGKHLSNKDFKDKIVIYTTIQPTCPDSCGITVWHLDQLIYQQLRKNKKKLGHVKLVSIVTNGKGGQSNNIQDVQYMLKDRIEGFDPSIWIVVSGDAKSIYNISNNGESLLKTGNEFFGGQAFQELMLLVDKKNHLRMVLPGKSESTIRTMRDHMALLEKEYDKKAAKARK